MITPALVRMLNPGHPNAEVAAAKLAAAAVQFGILTPRCQAMFMAQLAHESSLIPQEENLSYRAARLCQVWPGRFPTLASAAPYAFNPQALGDKVYGGRMGNGPNEGYRNRGRGLIQLTGRDNLMRYGQLIGQDLIGNPDLLMEYGVSAQAGGAFWRAHGLNSAAEAGYVRAVTVAINGGTQGLDDRERLYQRAVRVTARTNLLGEITEPVLNPVADAERDLAARQDLFDRILAA